MKGSIANYRSGYRWYQMAPSVFCCVLALLFLLSGIPSFAGVPHSPEDEITVSLNVEGIGVAEMPAIIVGRNAYLSVTDIFDFLKIKNTPSGTFDTVSGFFVEQKAAYVIDNAHSKIIYKDKTFDLAPEDMIRTETELYLKSDYFGKVFGLECTFDFHSLSVILHTDIELPVLRELRQEMMRQNINSLKGNAKADTTINRKYPLFHFGMADWSVITTQQSEGKGDTRANIALGATVAGGEADVSLNYSRYQQFDERQQYYLLRFANNDHKAIRQLNLGKIFVPTISSIYFPIVGAQVTNTPTSFRRSFGYYPLSDFTEPGWIVELYVNNVLVDFKKADASGFFTFDVPLVYGSTVVKLRFYGPWGEERSKEENISIPFTFLPAKELEYTASTGIVEDGRRSKFAQVNINYGLSRKVTVGGGVEYLSSITSGTVLPFVTSSVRLASSLIFSGEYTYGVRGKGILNYRTHHNLQIEVDDILYQKGQTAINYNYLEERKAIIALPIHTQHVSMFSRVTLDQITLPSSMYSTADWLLSGSVHGINTSLSTFASFIDKTKPYLYSTLSFSFYLPKSIIFTPQAQYEYNSSKLISLKGIVEKHLFGSGFLNLSYEENFRSNIRNIGIGLRYDFSFAQVAATSLFGDKTSTIVESARGSFIYDRQTRYHNFDNRTNVGKGGIVIVPFLDINCNGKRDEGEPKVTALKFRINGGLVEYINKDTTIRISDMEPYVKYSIDFDKNSFDNVAWKIRKSVYSVAVAPNQFTMVSVPVSVVGEASGMIYQVQDGVKRGTGHMAISIYNSDTTLAARAVSEPDGFFSYLGLPPGSYYAKVDTMNLGRLKVQPVPAFVPFTIKDNKDGDVMDGMDFLLQPLHTVGQSVPSPLPPPSVTVIMPTPGTPVLPLPGNNNSLPYEDSFVIQVGAFHIKENAVAAQHKLTEALHVPVFIVQRGLFYKVRVTGYDSKAAVEAAMPKISAEGFGKAFIVKTINAAVK